MFYRPQFSWENTRRKHEERKTICLRVQTSVKFQKVYFFISSKNNLFLPLSNIFFSGRSIKIRRNTRFAPQTGAVPSKHKRRARSTGIPSPSRILFWKPLSTSTEISLERTYCKGTLADSPKITMRISVSLHARLLQNSSFLGLSLLKLRMTMTSVHKRRKHCFLKISTSNSYPLGH